MISSLRRFLLVRGAVSYVAPPGRFGSPLQSAGSPGLYPGSLQLPWLSLALLHLPELVQISSRVRP